MRLAVMIIALCLTMIIGLQSCAASFGGALLADKSTSDAGAIGILLAFMFVLGAALVMHFPRTSGILFMVGGGIAILAGLGSQYIDLAVWGSVSLVLALMAFIGSRERRRQQLQTVVVMAPPYNLYPGIHPQSPTPTATTLGPVMDQASASSLLIVPPQNEQTVAPHAPDAAPSRGYSAVVVVLAIVVAAGIMIGLVATGVVGIGGSADVAPSSSTNDTAVASTDDSGMGQEAETTHAATPAPPYPHRRRASFVRRRARSFSWPMG